MKSNDIKHLVADMDKSVRSDDPRMRRSARITHEDGSNLYFRHAYMLRHGNWLLVFSEHQGSHHFNINDLSSYEQLEPVPAPINVVDEYGCGVVKLNCSFCQNEIAADEIRSVYDPCGNRIDADVCEGCEELHISHQFNEHNEPKHLELVD